ncbi:GNAT family N-acetyltransferase [Cellulophaga fucicola]|uniref:Acetyltransferase (GNAT) domain-containing protein n=1 Tax=Cellulophaga fucicola TaxID=76595 RepID=A0A1K1M354_9FLAO|nr:GNAT family N-acetyltransferase [Cellulophaga fucicola]SFW16374.1 Acetyltransferase (GNAT) domain-containing protein [Cellulophaga fucicola]
MLEKYFSKKLTNFVFCLFIEGSKPSFFDDTLYNSITSTPITSAKNLVVDKSSRHLIINIPSYIQLTEHKENIGNLKFIDVPQYKGFLVNLKNQVSTANFLQDQLSKRNQKNLRSKQKKLESSFKITNSVYFGSIEKNTYLLIFKTFYSLLKNRFHQKKTHNRYLADWDNLQTYVYHKILKKEASLFVLYDNKKPIGITLNFHLRDIVFSHIQAYDVDYSIYNIGDICMVNHITWCIQNNVSIFDLSMGETYYKLKWSNYHYNFYNRLYYNNNAIVDIAWVKITRLKFRLLQYLRDKQILGKYFSLDKLLYKVK